MSTRFVLSMTCLAALLASCGHATKSAQTSPASGAPPAATAQPAQPAQPVTAEVADATPTPEPSDLPASQPLDQNGQPVAQVPPPALVSAPAPPPSAPAVVERHPKPSPIRQQAQVVEPPPSIDIPSGTPVRVRLDQSVSTKYSRPGDRFHATLIRPVMVRGVTLVPRGTLFDGHVLEAKASGRFKGRAVLSIALDGFWLNGVRYPLSTSSDSTVSGRHRRRNWAFLGGGGGFGATVGAIAGGGVGAVIGAGAGVGAGTIGALVTGRKNVTFHAETPLTFRLRYDVAVSPAIRQG